MIREFKFNQIDMKILVEHANGVIKFRNFNF